MYVSAVVVLARACPVCRIGSSQHQYGLAWENGTRTMPRRQAKRHTLMSCLASSSKRLDSDKDLITSLGCAGQPKEHQTKRR